MANLVQKQITIVAPHITDRIERMAAISLAPNVSLDIYQNTQTQNGTFVDTTTSSAAAIQRRVSLTNYLNLAGNFESHFFQPHDGDSEGEVIGGHQFEEVSQKVDSLGSQRLIL